MEVNLDNKTKARFEARARILRAIAHPTRLFIVHELSQTQKCVCELTQMVGSDISTVSKHLAVLRSAGIVQDEKRGSQVFYKLKVPCVLNFLNCVESVIEYSAREQLDLVK